VEDVDLEWDESNVEHIQRHGIVPQEVLEVFGNETVDLNYEVVNGEERWTSVGHSNALRILVVVWTMRSEAIRPVTAFEAGKKLAEEYLKGKGM
jgi:uncharacterized DUF497 family protein